MPETQAQAPTPQVPPATKPSGNAGATVTSTATTVTALPTAIVITATIITVIEAQW